MKRILLLVGALTATLFTANTMAGDKEPNSGRFDFQVRKPESIDRFIPLEITMKGPIPTNGYNTAVGLNVYWKTKNKNMLQGRSYSAFQPNLPRAGRNFSNFGFYNQKDDRPNSENIEMLVWNEGVYGSEMDETFNNGCPPTFGNNFHTQFYKFRFDEPYDLKGLYPDISCSDAKKHVTVSKQPANEKLDVALTAFAFSDNLYFCQEIGEFCSKDRSRTVLIPSKNLDFLYVEIFVFFYRTSGGQLFEFYYTLPVTTIRFVPDSLLKENFMFVDYVHEYAPDANQFPGYNNNTDHGYLSDVILFHINEYSYKKYTNAIDSTSYNFDLLDKLMLTLSFANPGKVPDYGAPFETGMKAVVDLEYLDKKCMQDKTQCQYPTR